MSDRSRTRRDARRERTRAELLESAATVFAAHGFNGASVDQVAEAAGYTKGAVYSNFTSKEELFLELLGQQLDRTIEALATAVRDASPDELTAEAASWHATLPVLDGTWFLLEAEFLLYAARKADPSVRERVAERQRRTRARITALVEQHLSDLGIDQPTLPAEDVARLLMATADGLAQAALVDETARDGSRLFVTLLGILQRTTVDAAAIR